MVPIVLAILAALQPASPQAPVVVERSPAGSVSIGASAESVYREFGDRVRLVDLKLEGHLSPALEIKLFGAQLVPSIVAEIREST